MHMTSGKSSIFENEGEILNADWSNNAHEKLRASDWLKTSAFSRNRVQSCNMSANYKVITWFLLQFGVISTSKFVKDYKF